MDNNIYKIVQKRYTEKREKQEKIAQKKKERILKDNPEIAKLEEEKNMIAISTTKKIITLNDLDKQIEKDNMSIKLKKIDERIERELKKRNVDKKDLLPKFDCEKCCDTGITNNNGISEYCSCFKQEVINELYKDANISKLDDENFNTFDIGYYSNVIDESKYGISKSPMENINVIRDIAYNFSNNIKNPDQKNLLFIGNTGLGKTFLTNCIAKMAIENTNTVIYQTAPVFMDKIIEYKYTNDITGSNKELYKKIFDVDLLIIDDLGTETMTNNKFTELFNIINTRLLNNKKILISTNLTLNQLFERYDERVMSRIIGDFTICKFIGEDIRLKKKKMNK